MGKLMIWCVRFYQKNLSFRKEGPTCRFVPTCSEYAVQAIQRHGALCGGALALWRILRCNPFCKGGYDPVPEENPFFHFLRKTASKKENK